MSKFKVGDKVKVVHIGHGFGDTGGIYIIEEDDVEDYYTGTKGYIVKDLSGKRYKNLHNDVVGENSFELVEEAMSLKEKLEQMMQEAGVDYSIQNLYKFADFESIEIWPSTPKDYIEFESSTISVEYLDSIILSLMHIREQRKEK